MLLTTDIAVAAAAIERGEIIAYPTEAVYGLGCDPFNEKSVQRLLVIKQRPVEKGLIIVASDWAQVEHLTSSIPELELKKVFATWPGPHTWIFPASEQAPTWITGKFSSIAIRISAHPIVQALCQAAGPLVSTSANISNEPACRDVACVQEVFGEKIELAVSGSTSGLTQPTTIKDALTQQTFRS